MQKPEQWNLTGMVVEVDSKHVFLQIPELNEGKPFPVEITGEIPEWLLQKGMLFSVSVPYAFESMKLHDIALSHFRPDPYAHMTVNELSGKLLDSLARGEGSGVPKSPLDGSESPMTLRVDRE